MFQTPLEIDRLMPTDRRLLTIAVYALPILTTVLAVLLTAAWLLEGMRDMQGAMWVRIGAGATLVALAVDLVLLLGLLGFRALREVEDETEPPP